MAHYETLSPEIAARMAADTGLSPYAFDEAALIRRHDNPHDAATVWRTACIRDIDKIMHCPYYNRYADKTQVFSFYKNDDITRRSLHVQLVSRIARTIGRALRLNIDLIEAIALGHDIGHTPFGHAGETFLDELLAEHTDGAYRFAHNLQSVRVLDVIYPQNISLQTLSGIAAHDGELELSRYEPCPLSDFAAFDAQLAVCDADRSRIKALRPSTLEGCVVRIADILAYLGKDRQDAHRAGLSQPPHFSDTAIGTNNAEMLNNLTVNILENSYGKPYIAMDGEHFDALKKAKAENYDVIYRDPEVNGVLQHTVRPMMRELYTRLRADLLGNNGASPIFTHHIDAVQKPYIRRAAPYTEQPIDRIVADYIASMTDDYFVDLHAHLFPDSPYHIDYIGYFD